MLVELPAGKYVLAVSGGVDSMVLLDILAKPVTDKNNKKTNIQHPTSNIQLIVAHFDHGTRAGSSKDGKLVARQAKKLGLKAELGRGRLGPKASEERAREARYRFLRSVRDKYQADGIVTAHHQDDLIETAIINMLRGTGPRGLIAITQNPEVRRPLLGYPKKEILKYAQSNELIWREDPTNRDTDYLRNYVRRELMPKMTGLQRQRIIRIAEKVAKNTKLTNELIATISHDINKNDQISRQQFTMLPPEVGKELIMGWLRAQKAGQFDKKAVNKLYLSLKSARPGSITPVNKHLDLVIDTQSVHFRHH